MAFKQPRVPEFNEKDGVSRYLKTLVLFLKDFCQEVWVAIRQSVSVKQLNQLSQQVTNEKTERENAVNQLSQQTVNYRKAVNLLDNSDFRNPVNQRGVTSGGDGGQYFIDRWIFDRANPSATYTLQKGIGISFGSGTWLKQKLPFTQAEMDRKTFTVAVELSDGTLWTKSVMFTAEDSYDSTPWSGQGLGHVYSGDCWTVVIANLPSCLIKWIALYGGEYTTDNLPPYVPKGYDVEYLVCRRWFLPLPRWTFVFFCGCAATYSDAMISYGIPMYPIRAVNLSLGGVSGWYPVVQSSNSVRLRVDISTGWPNGYPVDVSADGCYISSEL